MTRIVTHMLLLLLTVALTVARVPAQAKQLGAYHSVWIEICADGGVKTIEVTPDGEPVAPGEPHCCECQACLGAMPGHETRATLLPEPTSAGLALGATCRADLILSEAIPFRNLPRGPPLAQCPCLTCLGLCGHSAVSDQLDCGFPIEDNRI